MNQFSIKFAGKFFDPLRVIKNSRLVIYLKLVNLLYCMASSMRAILGDQRQLVARMRYVREKDIFEQKCTSGEREPVGITVTEPVPEAFEILPAD